MFNSTKHPHTFIFLPVSKRGSQDGWKQFILGLVSRQGQWQKLRPLMSYAITGQAFTSLALCFPNLQKKCTTLVHP